MAESHLPDEPLEKNPSYPSKFRMDLKKFPDTEFFVQTVQMPGVNLDEPTQSSPYTQIPQVGNRLTFQPLTITMLVNEDYSNYAEILYWIYAATGLAEEQVAYEKLFSDGAIHIITNLGNYNKKIVFEDMFPTSLSPLQLGHNVDPNMPLTVDVTFRFSRFKIV